MVKQNQSDQAVTDAPKLDSADVELKTRIAIISEIKINENRLTDVPRIIEPVTIETGTPETKMTRPRIRIATRTRIKPKDNARPIEPVRKVKPGIRILFPIQAVSKPNNGHPGVDARDHGQHGGQTPSKLLPVKIETEI